MILIAAKWILEHQHNFHVIIIFQWQCAPTYSFKSFWCIGKSSPWSVFVPNFTGISMLDLSQFFYSYTLSIWSFQIFNDVGRSSTWQENHHVLHSFQGSLSEQTYMARSRLLCTCYQAPRSSSWFRLWSGFSPFFPWRLMVSRCIHKSLYSRLCQKAEMPRRLL